jgi:hypothetical protein
MVSVRVGDEVGGAACCVPETLGSSVRSGFGYIGLYESSPIAAIRDFVVIDVESMVSITVISVRIGDGERIVVVVREANLYPVHLIVLMARSSRVKTTPIPGTMKPPGLLVGIMLSVLTTTGKFILLTGHSRAIVGATVGAAPFYSNW